MLMLKEEEKDGVEKAERFEKEPDENTSAAERHVNYSSNKTLGEVEY